MKHTQACITVVFVLRNKLQLTIYVPVGICLGPCRRVGDPTPDDRWHDT